MPPFAPTPPTFVPAPPPADTLSMLGIGGLAVLMAATVVVVSARVSRTRGAHAAAVLGGWMAVTAVLAATGRLQDFSATPPPMAALMLGVFTIAGVAGLSSFGRALAAAVPLSTLVGLQSFRLPLELVMHRAGELGIMPPELSYGGYNFDIVTGAGALALWLLLRAGVAVPRAAIWTWNLWGLACLAVITWIAVASSPMVRAFGDDPRHLNTWVLYVPYVWLPAVLVVIALAGHLIVTRALLAGRASA